MGLETTANPQQAAAWDGDEGAFWVEHEDRFDAGIAALNPRFFAAAAIEPTDRVLDVGCGCGMTTRTAARLAWRGSALGVDLSARMLERARARSAAEGLRNVGFEHADAQVHPFPARAFDVVISRMGAMFFNDPIAAFTNLAAATEPNGRLALLVWQALEDNEWLVAIRAAMADGRHLPTPPPDAPSAFALSDPARVRSILGDAGYHAIELQDLAEPMYLGDDAEDATGFVAAFAGWMMADLDDAGKQRALDALRATMVEHDTGLGVMLRSRAWIVTATRRD
jgi:SAM-dependent methyltransferase